MTKPIPAHSKLFGLGLRAHHFSSWRDEDEVPPLEVLADNYLFQQGGPGLAHLATLRERCPILRHGVGLNIGSPIALNQAYLEGLRVLAKRLNPEVISDHFCFSAAGGGHSYDLLPLARTGKLLALLTERIHYIQDFLGMRYSLENISSYVEHKNNEMSELEFLNELADRTGCGILLDVNNVYVSAHNFGFDAWSELSKVKAKHVTQYHIAGHLEEDDIYIDTHDQAVKDEVWELMARSWQQFGAHPLILERDDEAPLAQLLAERALGLRKLESVKGVRHNHEGL